MLQTFRDKLTGTRGAMLAAVLTGILAAPAGCSSSDAPPPAQPASTAPQAAAARPASQASGGTDESVKLPKDQLEALVAPIALYPDPLLAEMLVASTYPLDVVAAQQWLDQNSSLKGEELTKAVEQQKWDPSVQGLVEVPEALKRLSENIKWTTDLGDAFLAQEGEIMDAVQSLRAKAKDGGKLQTTEQQKVETKEVDSKTVIEIQPASTEVVYVPTYSPSVIWGPLYYPYPPLYYPPYYGGAWLGFGVGIAIGIGISGGWGWGCGWGGGNNIIINNNNNHISHYNRSNNINRSGNSNWQHNAQQRGGAPYKDRATASKYGGGARGDSAQSRQAQAGQRQSQGQRASTSSMNRGASSSSQVGNRNVSSSSRSSSAFGGSQSGSYARSSSSRGASSMGGMRGGGGGRRR